MFKTVIMLVLALCWGIFAVETSVKYEVKIIERMVLDITGRANPRVCVVDYPAVNIQRFANSLIITSCSQADVVISSTDRLAVLEKPVIVVGTYPAKDEDIIGAIFWKKGRPQIILIEKNIKKFDITLPEDYKKFLIRKNYTDYVKSDT